LGYSQEADPGFLKKLKSAGPPSSGFVLRVLPEFENGSFPVLSKVHKKIPRRKSRGIFDLKKYTKRENGCCEYLPI
jgi:hypothetical protein